MKTTPLLSVSAFLLLGMAVCPSSVRAAFSTGFEDSQGYTGTTLNGVDDPVLSGTDAWYVPASYSNAGSRQTYNGSSALRILDSNSSAYAIGLNVANAIDYTQAFTLSFDLAVASASTGSDSTAAFSIRLGADTNSNSNKSWLRFSYNVDGSLSLWVNSGGTTTTQTNVGNLADYVTTGGYLSVSISVNPVTHTYLGLTLSGSLKTETITSVAGTVLPWIPNTAGEPPSVLWVGTTGAATSTSYIDNLSLSNIPEPSSFAALAGLGALALVAGRRRLIR